MAVDRIANLRERLRKGTFKFGALLEGVSTLDESVEPDPSALEPPETNLLTLPTESEHAVSVHSVSPSLAAPAPMFRREDLDLNPLRSMRLEQRDEGPELLDTPVIEIEAPIFIDQNLIPLSEPPPSLTTESGRDGRLKPTIETLHARLGLFLGQFAEACRQRDIEDAGFQLSQVNQVLELFSSVDPTGDLARLVCPTIAPPNGLAWPQPTWTLLEFADSPVSGLLPDDADLYFARDIVGHACSQAMPV